MPANNASTAPAPHEPWGTYHPDIAAAAQAGESTASFWRNRPSDKPTPTNRFPADTSPTDDNDEK